jgi:hypothetical protein
MTLLIFEASHVHFLGSDNVPCALLRAALFALCAPFRSRFFGGGTHRSDFITLHFNSNLC